MDRVPISFEHKGKKYSGFLQQVGGAGSSRMFHLMVDRYYIGQLLNTHRGWAFYSNSNPEMGEMADYFGEIVSQPGYQL